MKRRVFQSKIIIALAVLLLAAWLPATLTACDGGETAAATGQAASPEPTPPAMTTKTPSPTPSPTASPTAEPTPTPDPTPTIEPTPTPKPQSPYYIYVEKGSNTVTIYGEDDNGEYTVIVNQYLAALGKTAGRTPTGTFKIKGTRDRWHKYPTTIEGKDYVYAQYATPYYSRLYIHGPIYTSKRNDRLSLNSFYEIGKNRTAGCIRISAGGAHWIYTNCPDGTVVEIVNGSPRNTTAEPPEKPAKPHPNWDPSDPVPPGEEPENLTIPTPVPE